MKLVSRVILTFAAMAFISAGVSSRAEAATIVDLQNVVATATTLDADVVVSGLDQATGGFAFQVTFTEPDLTFSSITLDPGSKMSDGGNPLLDLSFPPAPGLLDIFVVSTLSDVALAAAQGPFPGATFTLAHLVFNRASATATTTLNLLNISLAEADGSTTIPLGGTAVPEPASMMLLGTGLGALAMRRRRQKAAQKA